MKISKYKQYNDGIIFTILTAISFVYIDQLGNHIDPLMSLLIMATGASMWFHLVNLKNLKKMYQACICDYQKYLMMTFCIGINWGSSIYAPHYSDPFIYLSIYFIILAICSFYMNYYKTKSVGNLFSCVILMLICLFINSFYVIGTSRNLILGIFLGILGGISAYFYAIISGQFSQKNHLSSSQILAVRFIPVCIILLILVKYRNLSLILSLGNIYSLIIMTIVSLIIPVYFYQQSILKLGAEKSSSVVAFTPVIVFIVFSLSQFKIEVNNLIIAITVLTGLIFPKFILRKFK